MNYSNDVFASPVPTSFYFFMGLVALLLMAIWIFFKWIDSRCPKCGKGWRIESSRQKVNDSIETKSESQNTGRVDGQGNTIYVTVQVPYVTTEYLVNWECSGCGNRWQTHEKKTRRG